MSKKDLPRLQNNILTDPIMGSVIVVGSSAWYEWLSHNTSFTLIDQRGRVTIRKELSRSGGWYWKAYRRVLGRLCSIYLGRSQDMGQERIERSVARLSETRSEAAIYERDYGQHKVLGVS
jgi:hypothetical protein